MADEILWIDHATDATGSPLQIGMGTSYALLSQSYPAPEQQVLYASSIDSEGELDVSRRYSNRTISLELEFEDPTGSLLAALQAKIGKLQREGGSLRRTYKDGTTIRVYDVISAAGWDPGFDLTYYLGNVVKVSITLPAKPLARGADTTQPDRTETALPCLIATETGITGDEKATAVWTVDNDAAVDWWGLVWGVESDRYYTFTTSSGSGGLYYEAESRTALGGSAIAVGPAGASGAGSNVMRNTALSTGYQAVLSTQATGGGAHLSHVGLFRVFARVQVPATNTGTVTVGFEYGEGDFRRYTQNAASTIDPTWEGTWRRVDLGVITLQKIPTGLQRWEGRVLAKSTVAGDDIDVDWLMFVPGNEGSGQVSAVARGATPTVFSARDEFDHAAGGLNGKTLPVGGTWSTGGGASDLIVATGGTYPHSATRAPSTPTLPALAGTATFTNVAVSVRVAAEDIIGFLTSGVLARYVDSSNYLYAVFSGTPGTDAQLRVVKNVAGNHTMLLNLEVGTIRPLSGLTKIEVRVFANGIWALFVEDRLVDAGYDAVLATGGALATGKTGIYDVGGVSFGTRYFDDFAVSVPPVDAAVFAGQSIQIRSDGVIREDSTGTFWQKPSSYEGDYLKVPVAGAEARSVRFIAAPVYGPGTNGVWTDDRIDDISARLVFTARYLT